MKKLFCYFTFLVASISYSQQEAANWYFGENTGIRFNSNGSTTNLTDGKLNTDEGCTTISDSDGNLLFYTDGITVWDKNHNPMPNANAALGNGLFGDPSSSQSAIVVPKPNDSNIYYIFTVDTVIQNDPDRGFNYSIVDLSLNGGLGDVISTSKNINLLQDSTEKISAVLKDCTSKSIWVITFASATGLPSENPNFNTFYAYEVSSTGINPTPVKSTFNIVVNDFRGYLKVSPDGTKLACANSTSGLYLYDFDVTTGKVSNQEAININFSHIGKTQSPYGIEFSQNNKRLYVSAYYQTNQENFLNPSSQYGSLLQYDLTATNINASEVVIDDRQMYRGALQLAPNGKIYRAMSATYPVGLPYLSVINTPNELGINCNYKHNAVALGRNSRQGLPPFIASFFSEKINITRNKSNSTYLPLCLGEKYTLTAEDIPGATYTWTFNDVKISESDFDLEVSKAGMYKVTVQTTTGDCSNILEGEALVAYFNEPIANPINDVSICSKDLASFNFSTQAKELLGMQDPLIYYTKFYKSQSDSELDVNEITLNLTNTSNPQRFYTRIGLIGNTTCFNTNISFLATIFDSPVVETVNPTTICDTQTATDVNITNGQTDIDLHQFDNILLGSQDPSKFSITYYRSISNAESQKNPLNFSYYNQTPNNETVYARIENKLNTDCFVISSPISITVNPLPEFTNATLTQCDEDGINDKRTTYNLLEAVSILTNGLPNRSVKFFKTLNSAENNTDEILNINSFKNTEDSQVLFTQIINDNTNCFSIAELTLKVSINKINDYIAPPVCDEQNSRDGINTFNLNDITADIQSLNSITFPINYYETYEDALLEKNKLKTPYSNVNNPYEHILYARVENNNACFGIGKIFLKINELPDIDTQETIYYCLNKFPETETIDAGILKGNLSNYSYKWSNGDTTYNTQINTIGDYTVTVTNIFGCSIDRTISVKATSIASFNPSSIPINVIQNTPITISVSGEGTYQYQLINSENRIVIPYQDSPIFENIKAGIYTVFVKNKDKDCGPPISSTAYVIGFPKFFTPNNDSINDTWQIIGVSNMFQANTKILIFNRFGKLIKELVPLGEGWDGMLNGNRLPPDDYWFVIKLQDGRTFKNHFTLKY
ncbi:hypothetical protein A8C32_06595 [Flavivirga aquatica]|uniref:T9SS type B sorting domain-containing protein n=1 Tax=Flavivirga aquatica TaxID=1849968 RepID=A0A1E5SIB0_9FLAO|nr:T9SS type B sorting domain-containing protein [Flavivirga aquatica]OEJ98851.1 hypothetical protein A8C32_06595 [Flavivirga aquatica]